MGATVYLVDDDAAIRKAIGRLLATEGLAVRSFDSARAFLAETPEESPACLVLDVRMPEKSGLDLQEELSATRGDLPIVFLTGHGDVPTSVEAMKAGADDFLQKPVEDEVLLDAVRQALTRSRAAHAEWIRTRSVQELYATLTQRERQVLELVVAGLLNKQIAGRLGTSEKTVKVHRGRMVQKMGGASVPELVLMAQKIGIQGPEVG